MKETSRGEDKELHDNNKLFLNVERVSMPDIDVDFRTDIRAKMIDYCRSKYGFDNICQIMTKSYGSGKGNLRLAARYLGERNFEEIIKKQQVDNDIEEENNDSFTNVIEDEPEIDDDDDKEVDFKSGDVEHDDYLRDWASEANKLSKEFTTYLKNNPDIKNPTLAQAFTDTNLIDKEQQIVTLADEIDNIPMGYGQHAAGVIISKTDVSNVIPLMWNSKVKSLQTQCNMGQAEAKGLLKMDFLGLQNLDIITEIMRYPTYIKDIDTKLQDYVERDKILKDARIYKEIFCKGYTQGVFQFESDGMKSMLKEFQPESFEDIVLLVAAYRPGPMAFVPEIIARKWYQKDPNKYLAPKTRAITSDNKALQAILEKTYGCPIYQEQVMKIFQDCAGYSLGRADLVRRAMSKKKVDYLAAEREIFIYGNEKEIELANKNGDKIPKPVEGCVKKQGMTVEEANQLFDQLMPFAEYGFNKSHATAYALVAMFTAYLKLYHTADFFRSSLNAETELKKYMPFIQELAHWGIQLKGPSIAESQNKFTVEDDGKVIRFGLQKIKGFSEQNLNRSTTMKDFIDNNPDISLKLIEEYAKLGMFEECWRKDTKLGRVKGNRHECLRWLQINGDLCRKYTALNEKVDICQELYNKDKENILNILGEDIFKEFDAKIKSGDTSKPKFYASYCQYLPDNSSEEEQTAFVTLLKSYKSNYSDMLKVIANKNEVYNLLNKNYSEDMSNGFVPKETPLQILENRQWEVEKLGISFDINDSLNKICSVKNKNTFKLLALSKEDNNNSNTISIPAIIISVSGEKKTKKNSIYYEVTLMDREKNIITRRFNEKPTDILDGIFPIPINECKYFNIKLSDYKPIATNTRKSINVKDAQTTAISIAQGNHIETVYTSQNKHFSLISNPNERKNDKTNITTKCQELPKEYYDIKVGDNIKIENFDNRPIKNMELIGKELPVVNTWTNKLPKYINEYGAKTFIVEYKNRTYYFGAENISIPEKNKDKNILEMERED